MYVAPPTFSELQISSAEGVNTTCKDGRTISWKEPRVGSPLPNEGPQSAWKVVCKNEFRMFDIIVYYFSVAEEENIHAASGETSDESKTPSLDVKAPASDVIKSVPRESLQKAGGSVGMGAKVTVEVAATCGVSRYRGGAEQLNSREGTCGKHP